MELSKLSLVAIKAEANYGVDPTPTKAANLLPIVEGSFDYKVGSTAEERRVMDGTMDRLPGYNTLPNVTVKFRYQMRGNIAPLTNYAGQAVTCASATDKITLAGHNLRNGDLVSFGGTAVPTGLTAGTYYYVVNAATDDFKVSATYGGAAIDLTSDGTLVTVTSKRGSAANGSANYAHELDAILQAANLKATYTAESALGAQDGYVVYSPEVKTDAGPSVTVYWWTGLKLHKLLGGKADISFSAAAGKMGVLEVTIQGKYAAVTDVAWSTAGATWVDTKPPLFLPASLGIGSVSDAVVSQLNWKLGNAIAMRQDALQSDGVKGFLITDTQPTGDLNPESVAEATHPLWADWLASTYKAITAVVGSVAGNRYAFTFGAEYKDVNYADSNGIRVHHVQFNIVRQQISSTAGGQFQIKLY